MNINNWYDTGEQIIYMVQDAIDRQDFSGLSSQISSLFGTNTGRTQAQGGSGNSYSGGGYAGQNRYQDPQPGKWRGIIMAVLGYGAAAVLAFMMLVVQAIGYFYWIRVGVTTTVLFVCFIAALIVGLKGSRKWSLAVRFGRYTRIMGNRTFCQLIEIASVVGRKESSVARDLKAMIKAGFFPEGHLDRKETCFITDNVTYQQYLAAQRAYEERLRDEKQEKKKSGKKKKNTEAGQAVKNDGAQKSTYENESLSPEVRELVEEGRRYILHIRECNDRIPGEEMSDKLFKLERITARIFAEAEKNPEVAGDLKKMMNYYLPTLSKLLDAYCDLDAQPVQGENIVNTKREIEKSIDTINEAFANLLDSLFEDTAWDISSDISVLNTMFAQEGLTGRDFDKNKNKEKVKV